MLPDRQAQDVVRRGQRDVRRAPGSEPRPGPEGRGREAGLRRPERRSSAATAEAAVAATAAVSAYYGDDYGANYESEYYRRRRRDGRCMFKNVREYRARRRARLSLTATRARAVGHLSARLYIHWPRASPRTRRLGAS